MIMMKAVEGLMKVSTGLKIKRTIWMKMKILKETWFV